jgi:hypothetical protein
MRSGEYQPAENALGTLAPGPVNSPPHNPRKQRKNPAAAGSGERFRGGKWRRGRDSNPRDGCPPTPLAGERLRPLGHLSGRPRLRTKTHEFKGIFDLAQFFHEQTPDISSPGTDGAHPACLTTSPESFASAYQKRRIPKVDFRPSTSPGDGYLVREIGALLAAGFFGLRRELSWPARCLTSSKAAAPDRFHNLQVLAICCGNEPWCLRIYPHWCAFCARR